MSTPGVSGQEEDDLEDDEPLRGGDITCFRGVAARCNYFRPDRPDCNCAIEECCREMSAPTTGSLRRLKRLGRYLKGSPRVVWRYDFQPEPEEIVVFSDANWANCSRSRKSISGGCIMYGTHLLRAWSKTQATIVSSSGESETLAAIRGGTEALGMLSLLHDLGVDITSTLRLDASAALGILQRKGVGKIRHLDVGCVCGFRRKRLESR